MMNYEIDEIAVLLVQEKLAADGYTVTEEEVRNSRLLRWWVVTGLKTETVKRVLNNKPWNGKGM